MGKKAAGKQSWEKRRMTRKRKATFIKVRTVGPTGMNGVEKQGKEKDGVERKNLRQKNPEPKHDGVL